MRKGNSIAHPDTLFFDKQLKNYGEVLLNKKSKLINKNEIERNLNVIEDKAQDCNAYLKIKHFLANQVMGMESIIEEKDSFIMGTTIKINSLTLIIEKFKNKLCLMNKKIKRLREKNKKMKLIIKSSNLTSDKSFASDEGSKLKATDDRILANINSTLSLKDDAISCYSFEKLDKNKENKCYSDHSNLFKIKTNKENEKLKLKTNKNVRDIEKLEERIKENDLNFQKRYQLINLENLKLTQRNFILNNEINQKNCEINKLVNQNILILNELVELIYSLRTIDIKNLNKIYLKNLSEKKKEDLEILNVTSCLGIKYNILSAESFLSYLINTNKNNTREKKNKFESLKQNFPNGYKHLKIENYLEVGVNENLLFKGKCNLDFEATTILEDNNINSKTFGDVQEEIFKKKLNKEENAELKIRKNYEEDFLGINSKWKKSIKEKYLYNSLFDLDDSDSISIDSSLENYLEAKYPNKNDPMFVYELSKDIENKNIFDNFIENQNKLSSKFLHFTKYEEQLKSLLERNLKKTKILTYPDSE